MLIERNINTPDAVEAFLKPKLNNLRSPALLPGVSQATEVVMQAVRDGLPMVVYGDYDADGMTGTAILYLTLKRLGANVVYHLPSRAEEGYGLHVEIVERLFQHGKRLLITVDCGIASIDAAEKCRELGMKLVVTDHQGYEKRYRWQTPSCIRLCPGQAIHSRGCVVRGSLQAGLVSGSAAAGGEKVDPSMRSLLLQMLGLAAIVPWPTWSRWWTRTVSS